MADRAKFVEDLLPGVDHVKIINFDAGGHGITAIYTGPPFETGWRWVVRTSGLSDAHLEEAAAYLRERREAWPPA